jgi:hypothetical protein
MPEQTGISKVPAKERPKVGVGVVIHDGKGNIVMGERIGSHGAGMFDAPICGVEIAVLHCSS